MTCEFSAICFVMCSAFLYTSVFRLINDDRDEMFVLFFSHFRYL